MRNLEIFAKKLKEIRLQTGKTQKEFANMVESTAATISAYENATKNPSLEIVMNIAEKCNVSIDWLCGLTEKKNYDNKVETYADVIKKLDELMQSDINMTIYVMNNPISSISQQMPSIPVIFLNNKEILDFLWDYMQILDIKDDGVIDEHLYRLWVDDALKKFNGKIIKHEGAKEQNKYLKKKRLGILPDDAESNN